MSLKFCPPLLENTWWFLIVESNGAQIFVSGPLFTPQNHGGSQDLLISMVE